MKVALISCFGYYEQRIKFVERELHLLGHSTQIFFSDFDHINKKTMDKRISHVEYLKTKAYKKNLSFGRLYSHFLFARAVYKRLNQEEFDMIYAIIPPNALCYYLKKYKQSHRLKLVFDVYDLWPESFTNKKIEKIASPFFSVWKNLRNKSLNAADYVVTECDLYHKALHRFVSKSKLGTIYLSKDNQGIKSAPSKNFEEELHICYLGSMNNIINIKLIQKFLAALKAQRKVTVDIIGKGESKDSFIAALKEKDITVCDHGAKFGDEKDEILKTCHFGINMMIDEVEVGLTMKSIDYFENCLPLLNNIKGDTWDFVEKANIGFNISEATCDKVAAEMVSLIKTEYDEMVLETMKIFNENFSSKSFHNCFTATLAGIISEQHNESKNRN